MSGELPMQLIYLWGEQGVGRTHLLQAACHELSQAHQPCFYLSLSSHNEFDTAILAGLEKLPLICLDDLHCISGHPHWEEALFHLYNRLLDSPSCLLVTSDCAAHYLPLTLADLKSRLTAGVTCQLHSLSDEDKCDMLVWRAKQRGMVLSYDVAQFLVNRLSRDTTTLLKALSTLDDASLAAKRRLTLPFVKSVFSL